MKKKQRRLALRTFLGKDRFALGLIALLAMFSALANVSGTYMLKPIVNEAVVTHNTQQLMTYLVVLCLIYLVGVVSTLIYTQWMVRIAQRIIYRIREALFVHLESLPVRYFDTTRHGEIMSHFTNDIDALSDALNNSFTLLVQSFTTTVGTIVMMIWLSWRLSLVVFVALALMFLYVRLNARHSRRFYRQQQLAMEQLNGYVQEMVRGQRVAQVFHHQTEDLVHFDVYNERLRDSAIQAASYAGRMIPSIVSLSYAGYAAATTIGALMILMGRLDVGALTAFLVYVRQSAMPLNQLTQQVNLLLIAGAAAGRIFAVLDEEPDIDQGTIRYQDHHWILSDGTSVPVLGAVQFDHVRFGYQRKRPILRDLTLAVKPGEMVAFVGSTGAGKTTIINLLSRFYDVDSGSILIDGLDLRQIRKQDLRSQMATVLQDTRLFTGTIMENLRYGRKDATDKEVIQAAQEVNADYFISRLPEGYQTVITQNGASLSAGQRQLLSIARAAVARPQMLILDEATAAIDTRTERLIEQGLQHLMQGRTVFVIAHRLSTVQTADLICVIEAGRIIEQGTHTQLLAMHGRYEQLYTGRIELA